MDLERRQQVRSLVKDLFPGTYECGGAELFGRTWVSRGVLEGYVRFEGPDGPEVIIPCVWTDVSCRYLPLGVVQVDLSDGMTWADLSGLALDTGRDP